MSYFFSTVHSWLIDFTISTVNEMFAIVAVIGSVVSLLVGYFITRYIRGKKPEISDWLDAWQLKTPAYLELVEKMNEQELRQEQRDEKFALLVDKMSEFVSAVNTHQAVESVKSEHLLVEIRKLTT